jgi:hypothetical protein
LLAGPGCPSAFLIEDEERTQADVGDLFFGESEFVIRYDVLGRYIRCHCRSRCRRCAANQRQRHPNSSQHWYGFLRTPSLRTSLRVPHVGSSNAYHHEMFVARISVRLDRRPCKSVCAHHLRTT